MTDGLQLALMRAAQHAPPRPTLTGEDARLLAGIAWHTGAAYTLARLAERADELDTIWNAPGWRSWHQQVGDRLALFEACAVRTGRPEYRGGPVTPW